MDSEVSGKHAPALVSFEPAYLSCITNSVKRAGDNDSGGLTRRALNRLRNVFDH
jgi:hypothetical protein